MRFSVVAAIALLAATPSLAYLEERWHGLANTHIPSEYNAGFHRARDLHDFQLTRRADPVAEYRKANLHAAAAAATKEDAAYKKRLALSAHHTAEANKHAYAAADLTQQMYHSDRRADPVAEHRTAEAEHRQKANLHSAAAASTKDDAVYRKHTALASLHHAEANKHAYAAAEHASNAEHSSHADPVWEHHTTEAAHRQRALGLSLALSLARRTAGAIQAHHPQAPPVLVPLPNMGQVPGVLEPPNVDHESEFKDKEGLVDVFLTVVPKQKAAEDNHWMIRWHVVTGKDGVVRSRILHVVQDMNLDGTRINHLTNWGPVTVSSGPATLNSPSFLIKKMTLTERKALEQIARNEQVMVPNGQWNCQDWTESVLQKAVNAGMITAAKLAELKAEASKVVLKV